MKSSCVTTDRVIGPYKFSKTFAARAPFPVKVVCNAHSLGSTASFLQVIRYCTGSLIPLSDRDDQWHPTRLQHSEYELANRPQASLLFSDADQIVDQGKAHADGEDGVLGANLKIEIPDEL